MPENIHQNDIGTVFKLTIKDSNGNVVDISSASVKQVVFKKPDLTTVTKNCNFLTDGTDGIVTYTVASGDLDVAGIWMLQTYVVISGDEFRSNIISFKVHRNI